MTKGADIFSYAALMLTGVMVSVLAGCGVLSRNEDSTREHPHTTLTIASTPTLHPTIVIASPNPSKTPFVEKTANPLVTHAPHVYLRNVHLAKKPFPAHVEWLVWSPDSTTLYYLLPEGLFEYSIKNNQSTPSNLETLPVPSPDILSMIPATARDISISPSATKVLYTMPIPGMKTPTYPPTTEADQSGEVYIGTEMELWLMDKLELVKIGQIEGCVDRYYWSDDETMVVIGSLFPPGTCNSNITAWVLDLNKRKLSTLWTDDRYPGIYIQSISPDGTQIQFDRDFTPFLYNIETSQFIELPYPSFRYSHWLDNGHMVVLYYDERSQSYMISKINADDLSEEKLVLSRDYSKLKDQLIGEISVSPDKRFITFLAGDDQYLARSIWILDLLKTK